jgi:glycosyltransferase involved in cell wall biosynthesis
MRETGVEMPLVSVVVLTINRPQFLDAAIRSVVNQSYSTWELLVLHDGPDLRIEPIVAAWSVRDSRVRYFHRDEIGNIANGLNQAIRLGRGEFVAILDDDDTWIDPRKLEQQVTALLSDHSLVAVGGGATVVDEVGREVMHYTRSKLPEDCARWGLLANPVVHSTVLFRKEAAERVGLYDEDLSGYQDWDLFLKLMRIGKVANLEGSFATYRVWDGGGTSRNVMKNAWSAMRIVNRHGRYYRNYPLALISGIAYLVFASLPATLRRSSYQSLSRLKKKAFVG